MLSNNRCDILLVGFREIGGLELHRDVYHCCNPNLSPGNSDTCFERTDGLTEAPILSKGDRRGNDLPMDSGGFWGREEVQKARKLRLSKYSCVWIRFGIRPISARVEHEERGRTSGEGEICRVGARWC